MNELINEFIGAVMQVVLFSLIPFVWWLISTAITRKKENFFKWIGIKKINHNGNPLKTIVISVVAVLIYGLATTYFINSYAGDVTSAGSQFAGKGMVGIPLAFIYGLIRTGLSEEILFRGFILKRVSSKFGFIAGNTIQAIAFGLMHGIPFGAATNNIEVTVLLTILPALLGFYMGWLNEKKNNGSIISSWLLHGITNTVVTIISL